MYNASVIDYNGMANDYSIVNNRETSSLKNLENSETFHIRFREEDKLPYHLG